MKAQGVIWGFLSLHETEVRIEQEDNHFCVNMDVPEKTLSDEEGSHLKGIHLDSFVWEMRYGRQ